MILLGKTDCASAIGGTGTQGCKVGLNLLTKFFLMEEGSSFDLTTDTLDRSTIDRFVQSGELLVLPAHETFTSETEETVYETLPSGVKLPVRNGLYEFLPLYTGVCLSNALSTLSTKKWSLFLGDIDDSGNARIWGDKTTVNKFKGFSTSLVFAENMQFNDGTVSTKTPLRIQLSTKGSLAMKSNVDFLSSNDDVDFGSLDGVNDVILNVTSPLAASFTVEASVSCDGTTPISSNIDVSNWKVTDTSSGLTVVPSGITYVNDAYLIAGIPAGTYEVKFYDTVASENVVISSDRYYKSDTVTVTLT